MNSGRIFSFYFLEEFVHTDASCIMIRLILDFKPNLNHEQSHVITIIFKPCQAHHRMP